MPIRSYFSSLYTAPPNAAVNSRDATSYLMRGIFFMGIRSFPKHLTVLYVLWAVALNLFSTIYQPIGFFTSYMRYMSQFTAGELFSSLQVGCNVAACSMKVIILWQMHSCLDRANKTLDEIDKRCTQNAELQKIRSVVAISNRIYFTFLFSYVLYTTLQFITSVTTGRPPYQSYYPILDWRADRTQFWIQAFLEYFGILGACLQNSCLDSYPLIYVLVLRTHVQMLTVRVRNLGTYSDLQMDEQHQELINCITHHKLILRYCDEIRPVMAGTIFVQFLVMGVVMGVTLINIVLFSNFSLGLASSSFLFAVMLETTPLCILCNYLLSDCDNLARALFESNWIHAEQRYKKTVQYFLQRVQQPIIFKAFNVPITIATNFTIIRFSFSVFTLVKQMNIADRLQKFKS